MNAAELARVYGAAGLACEIEAGPHGLVIYTSTRVDADRIAADLAKKIRPRDPRVGVTLARHDPNEPKPTAWWSSVDFEWSHL